MKDKIQTNLQGVTDSIFWYIKFNIPLDETSVSEKTMSVTDTDGYLMRTEITYDDKRHSILISPFDSYEQEVFYVLRISRKVRSASGNALKTELYILFKLKDNQISEYKTLKSHEQVPPIKKRPPNYDTMFKEKISRSKLYSFDEKPFKDVGQDKLPTHPVRINLLLGIFGLAIIVPFVFLQVIVPLFIGLSICLIGLIHIIIQLRKKEMRSVLAYNKGVRHFNKGRYRHAEIAFKKAVALDDYNERAEYALNKVSFYR
jgi:tetratricopeptide (TPR) repeat protein